MKGFTKGLVKRRILVIVVCLLLLVPSVLGIAATKTKYDLLYYLPQELETVKGQEILLEDFGKGAFSLLVTEGMSMSEQADMENALKEIPHVDSVIGFASITKGMFPTEIIPSDIREMFQRGDCMLAAVFFDEGSSSEETMEAISQVRKTAGEKCFVSGLSEEPPLFPPSGVFCPSSAPFPDGSSVSAGAGAGSWVLTTVITVPSSLTSAS